MQRPINDSENTDNLIQKRDDRAASISKVNKEEHQQLTNLQTKYNVLQTQYNITQKKLNNNSLESIKRVSPDNPYLNKNIRFTTGHVCYVNNLGVVKFTLLSVHCALKITETNSSKELLYLSSVSAKPMLVSK